ncbi:hypothetical protein Godav_000161 [Gossypium davidsonii]|uniref:Uncharacterized protein n=1 Tax=Gossypium davidsonii TaxID=34287 RepID=A0A7J8T836_GOSDV|nr:hypothetical protein [Gossypium davidsonii]
MLKHLVISGCPVLECIAQDFHETVDLKSIRISNAENIKSLPRGLDKLSHPQEIEVDGCPSLVSFEESGLPTTNLRVLKILNCENFGALPKYINNFTSLRELKVRRDGNDAASFSHLYPHSKFQEFGIHVLQGLSTTHLSLRLQIDACPKLTSLPGKDMLLSLERLYIYHCPLLEGCSRCKGREWSKIARIPCVRIQGERVIPRELY